MKDLHYFTQRDIKPVAGSEIRYTHPYLVCHHCWNIGKAVACVAKISQDSCIRCGAKAERDASGKIISYDTDLASVVQDEIVNDVEAN